MNVCVSFDFLAVCSTCKYGMYISRACAADQDTMCSHCTKCLGLRYEMSECTAGKDTVCGTCEQCKFRDEATQRECGGAIYDQWFDTNCCFDSEGNEVNDFEFTVFCLLVYYNVFNGLFFV